MSGRAGICVLVSVVAVIGWMLTTPPIVTRGEAREALVVHDILANNHWVIAYRDGTLASKPPLFHWIGAVSARVFTERDAAIRLPSALAAFALVAATAVVGSHVGVGWLAAAILAANPFFWLSATEARVDMVFAACVTAALAGFFVWYRRASGIARCIAYAALAAAVLAKGPAGAVLPATAIALFLAWEGQLSELRRFVSPALVVAAVLVVVG